MSRTATAERSARTRDGGNYSTPNRFKQGGSADGVNQYGNQYGVRQGGGGFAANSKKHDDRIARFAPFFGQLTQDKSQDPYDDYARDTFSLPEAYHGPNAYLRRILATWISEAEQWPIREMLPWKKFEGKFQIEWDTWTFDDHMLERVPERSAGRLLTSRKESHHDYMVRYGIALLLEHEFLDQPDGAENYRKNLLQIVNASIETFCHGAMLAVMDDKNIGVPKRHLQVISDDDNKASSIEARLRYDMAMWGIVQKVENGLEMAIDRCEETLIARLKRSGDYIVLPRGVGKYVKGRPENRYFFIAGPSTGGNAPARRAGVTIREGRAFRVGVDQPDVDPMQSERTIGGFFVMTNDHLDSVSASEYKTSMLATIIFSETHDDWYTVKYTEALLKCGLFKKSPLTGKWDFGVFGRKIFTKEGDLTVGDFLDGCGQIDKVVESIMALPQQKFWRFIQDVTAKYVGNDSERNARSDEFKGANSYPASLFWNNTPGLELRPRYDEEAGFRPGYGGGGGSTAATTGRPGMSSRQNLRDQFMTAYDKSGDSDIVKYNRRYWAEMLLCDSDKRKRNYDNLQQWKSSLASVAQETTILPFDFVAGVGSAILGNRRDAVAANRFSLRWRFGAARAQLVDSAGKPVEEKWYIHLRPGKRNHAISSGLQAIANPTDNGSADQMVIVGAPVMKYAAAKTHARQVRLHTLTDETKIDTSVCSRALGEALHIIGCMNGISAEDVAKEVEGTPSLANLWKACKKNLRFAKESIDGVSFTIHPACFAFSGCLEDLVAKVVAGTLSQLDTPAGVRDFLASASAAFDAVYPEKPDATNVTPAVRENDDAIRRRVEALVTAVQGDSGSGSGFEAEVKYREDDMDLPASMRSRDVDESKSAAGQHPSMRFTASRLQMQENLRKRKVWQSARDDIARKAEESGQAETPIHMHPSLAQFDETQWGTHAYVLRLTPNIYNEYENIVKAIYRRRVLGADTRVDGTVTGDMTKSQFVKLMALTWQAHEASKDKYDLDRACKQTAAFLLELYHANAIDIPELLSKLENNRSVSAAWNGRIQFTAEGVSRFLVEAAKGNAADERSLMNIIEDTSAHLLFFLMKCGDKWFDEQIAAHQIIVANIAEERKQAGTQQANGVRSMYDIAKLAVDALTTFGAGAKEASRGVSGAADRSWLHPPMGDVTAREIRAMLFEMTIDDGEFWRICCESNVAASIGLLGFRPHQTYLMLTMVYMRAYGEAGWTFEGQQDFQLGEDAYRKMIFGNFTMYGKSLVMVKEAVTHARDMFSKGHVSGNGVEVWDPNDLEDVANYKRGEVGDKDIFFCYVPMNWRPKTWYMDITGHLSSDLGGSRTGPTSWPDAKTYAEFWEWRNLSSFTRRPLSDQSNNYGYGGRSVYRNNTLVFQDCQKLYNHGTRDWTTVRKNEGPWGPNVMPGTAAARRGERMCLPVPTYLNEASTRLTAA